MDVKKSIQVQPLSRDQVRQIDRIAIDQYGMSGLVLMENAGRGAAEVIDQWLSAKSPRQSGTSQVAVCILCGKGNNAGDGYVIARHLQWFGYRVRIVSSCPFAALRGDAAANFKIAMNGDIPMSVFNEAKLDLSREDCVVECLLGTGASGAPKEPMASMIREANQFTGLRVAIDIPAGLDCDTGTAGEPTFRADLTCTFVAPKIGFALADGPSVVGELAVVPIGVPEKCLRELL